MATLYEMSAAARQLYEMLDNGDIDEQTVRDTMESIGASEKLEAYCYIQKQKEAEIEMFKAEIDRMTDRVHSLQRQVDRMKDAQVEFMRATGQKSANAGTFRLRLLSAKSVRVVDQDAIPAAFITEKPATYQPDKKAILAALKAGESVPGCEIETSFSVSAR